MKDFKIITLVFAFIILSLKANAHNWNSKSCEDSNLVGCWDCGSRCTAKLNTNGELVISGTGAINGGSGYNTTFSGLSVQPTSIKIEEGITSVGTNAFWYVGSINTLDIPNSLGSNGIQPDGLTFCGAGIRSGGITKLIIGAEQNLDFYRISQAPNLTVVCRGDVSKCETESPISQYRSASNLTTNFTDELRDNNGKLIQKYNQNGYSLYDENENVIAKYTMNGRLLEEYVHASDGSIATYDANGKLIGLKGKRIFTIDEATALVQNNKNTFTLKYR